MTKAFAFRILRLLFWRHLPQRQRSEALYRAGLAPAPRDPDARIPQTVEMEILKVGFRRGKLAEVFLSLPRAVRLKNRDVADLLAVPHHPPERSSPDSRLQCKSCGQMMPRHLMHGEVCDECLEKPSEEAGGEGGSRHLVDESRRRRAVRYGRDYRGGVE